ncbi:MAG: arginase family protein [Solirubrobacterales bacterium]
MDDPGTPPNSGFFALDPADPLAAAPDHLDELSMRWLHWWGPATFFGAEHRPDPAGLDIGVLGVPHSTGNGSTQRDQHLGPRAIRDVSSTLGLGMHPQLHVNPFESCRIADVGDVLMREFMVSDRAILDIERRAREIVDAGARLASVGGDHSITLPLLRALGRSPSTPAPPMALVHLDSHQDDYHDVMPEHWFGVRYSAGHWASWGAREGLVDPGSSLQIGMRGRVWDGTSPASLVGYQVIDRDEFDELGVERVVELIRERVGDRPIYVSFDLDVLDTAAAPAASNLEPGEEGLSMREALRTLRGLHGLEVIGADVVCYVPTKEPPNKITGLNASAVLFELLCLISEGVRNGRQESGR